MDIAQTEDGGDYSRKRIRGATSPSSGSSPFSESSSPSSGSSSVFILSEGMRRYLGESCEKYATEEDLKTTLWAKMLGYLQSKGELQACELFQVQVQTLSGKTFPVTIQRGQDQVAVLKGRIEDIEGTCRHRQELFVVTKDLASEETTCPLKDDDVIPGQCTVMLVQYAPPEWEWLASSSLVKTKEFKLSGDLNCIATKAQKNRKLNNCMMASPAMTGGVHTISLKVMQGSNATGLIFYCGIVTQADELSCNLSHHQHDSTVGWFISNGGTLHGNGKAGSDYAGEIKPGAALTMRCDLDAGSLNFFVDGKPHGPGYSSGVKGQGSFRWAFTLYYRSNAIEILPNPKGT